MRQRIEQAKLSIDCFRLGILSALELEEDLTQLGFYNVTFEPPITAVYLGIKYELETL